MTENMTEKKKLLLISYYFAPQNLIGAVRPTKLAKYLTRMGYEVTVLCGRGMDGKRDETLARDCAELHDVRVLEERNLLRAYKQRRAENGAAQGREVSGESAPEKSRNGAAHKLRNALYLYLRVWSDRSFQRLAIRELKKLEGPFDVVFSTYAPLSVHEAAWRAKKSGLAKRWIADFRDEVGVSFRWMKPYQRRYMRMAENGADLLTAVSNGFLEMMGLEEKGRMLPNGFDREDLPAETPEERTDGEFRVVYCGQFIAGRKNVASRDIRPAFRALAKAAEEKRLPREKLKLVYCGGEGALFAQYAAECGLGDRVEDHGTVSRGESLRLQQGADALLMASWYRKDQKGVLTGKLFEYMMMGKPILCCMAGDLEGSELKAVLEETGMGYCAEAAQGETAQKELEAYVDRLLQRWKEGKPLLEKTDGGEEYGYPRLARKLDEWLREMEASEKKPE